MPITLTDNYGRSVTFTKDLAQDSFFRRVRMNHATVISSGGNKLCYDAGPSVVLGELKINLVTKAEAMALIDFIDRKIIYSLRPFSITANSYDDLDGSGSVTLANCKWDGSADTKDYVKPRGAGGKWDVVIPYRVVSENFSGLGVEL